MIRPQKTTGSATANFRCIVAGCNGRQGRPFCWARFPIEEANSLIGELRSCAQARGRKRYVLQWTEDDAQRVRLLTGVTPKFEMAAAHHYVRGDAIRVTGESSFNIEFSKHGAAMLADELEGAVKRANAFVELSVPNLRNRRDLLEFRPDTETSVPESMEHDGLGVAGELIAGRTLGAEDFSDWESPSGQA